MLGQVRASFDFAQDRLCPYTSEGFAQHQSAATARALLGTGRERNDSCSCRTMSPINTENATQVHTIVSMAGVPSFSHPVTPEITRTSRKTSATAKLRVIH